MPSMDELARQLDRPGGGILCPGVFILRHDGQVLVGLRHYSRAAHAQPDLWTIPGGRTEIDETVEQALRRETAEETGITDLAIEAWLGDVPGGRADGIVPIFVGRTSQGARLLEPEKFSEWRWCDPRRLPEPFINPASLKLLLGWLSRHSS